ncbi:MAG: DUF4194 domain-containing protein [Bryobacterales bacterium]|nr:DUF4194 domain-containing protein [Bryobacterales bacterium]
MQSDATSGPALTHLATRLLRRGVVYGRDDETFWNALLQQDAHVRDFFKALNLQLEVKHEEGFAYLRSRPDTGDRHEVKPDALVARQPLSYWTSLILGLLRKRLAELDATEGAARLVMTLDEFVDMVRVYLPDTGNEPKQRRLVQRQVRRIGRMGFLRLMKAASSSRETYEVERILVEFVTAEWLADLDAELARRVAGQSTPAGAEGE